VPNPCGQVSERKDFFFEKKKQKTFVRLEPRWTDLRGSQV
jgi:hypothetical protein